MTEERAEKVYRAMSSDGDFMDGSLDDVVAWTDEHFKALETMDPEMLHTIKITQIEPVDPAEA